MFVFKTLVDLSANKVELVKCMQVGGDMENYWIMFDHVKHLKDWTTMACHVYNTNYCKLLTKACCDMQYEDSDAQTLFWVNLNGVMVENGMSHVNYKGFMVDNAQANYNVVRKIYGNGDPTMAKEDCERTFLFHWFANLDKITQKFIKPCLHSQHKKNLQGLQGCSYNGGRGKLSTTSFIHGGCLRMML